MEKQKRELSYILSTKTDENASETFNKLEETFSKNYKNLEFKREIKIEDEIKLLQKEELVKKKNIFYFHLFTIFIYLQFFF